MQRFVVALVVCCLFCGESFAKPSSGGSSRPSSSSSSKPSPSSRPSSSFSSKPTPAPSKPTAPSPSSRPSSSFSSKPTPAPTAPSPSSRPSSSFSSKPTPAHVDSSVSSKPTPPAVSSPSSRPSSSFSSKTEDTTVKSSKPTTIFNAAASSAQKKTESKVVFQAANKPKESYTTQSGKTVSINAKDPTVNTIRNIAPEKIEQHTTRVEHHYHSYPRYDYYRSQPYVYVGNGYSSLFWYSMMDWNAQRRAEWLYHNQSRIDSSLYQQQLQNADLRLEIEKLKNKNVAINPEYVDSEFKENPDLMYDNDYVKATYNPVVTPIVAQTTSGVSFGFIVFMILFGVIVVGGIYFVFIHQFKGDE